MGSKQHHVAVLKRLKEAIEKEKDPDRLATLTANFVKLNAQKRPRKSKEVPSAESKVTPSSSLLAIQTGNSFVDSLPDKERITHHLMLRLEAKYKSRGVNILSASRAEKDALWKELINSLSEDDRVMVQAFDNLKGC